MWRKKDLQFLAAKGGAMLNEFFAGWKVKLQVLFSPHQFVLFIFLFFSSSSYLLEFETPLIMNAINSGSD